MNLPLTRVLILCGGESPEHEISLLSSQSVIKVLDREQHVPWVVGIQKTGEWQWFSEPLDFVHNAQDPKRIRLKETGIPTVLGLTAKGPALLRLDNGQIITHIDLAFPILHGPFGEDGTVQGLLKMMHVPFVGASVLGTAIGMDKAVMKRLLRDAGIPTADFRVLMRQDTIEVKKLASELGFPMFVKPANMGSSVGIAKIPDESCFHKYVEEAFQFDHKILLEKAIQGRELECAVLGNEDPIVSLPGEIVPVGHEFYSYEAKYLDDDGAELHIPAPLEQNQVKALQKMAIDAYQALECEGMARVDLFMDNHGRCYLNEINTIPGFTKISMYPKLWEISGIPYAKLVDRLLVLAQARAKREAQLTRNRFL